MFTLYSDLKSQSEKLIWPAVLCCVLVLASEKGTNLNMQRRGLQVLPRSNSVTEAGQRKLTLSIYDFTVYYSVVILTCTQCFRMLQARPNSPDDSEEFDDVFDDNLILIPTSAKKKQCLSKCRSLKTSHDSYLAKEMIHPLNDLNKSLDSDETQEPYKRRGSAARMEKRRPSNKPSSFVTFAEILSHFQNQDPMKMQRILAEQNAKRGNGKILGIFSPHPRLPANLDNEKDIFLLMAETK